MKFPDDFEEKQHPVVPDATHWIVRNKEGVLIISIIGGGPFGDGLNVFEVLDNRSFADYEPKMMSKEEINQYLKDYPLSPNMQMKQH